MDTNELRTQLSQDFDNNEVMMSGGLYGIIFILNNLKEHHKCYVIAKKFITTYLQEVSSSSYGYDQINEDKIIKIINLFNGKEQIKLIEYYISIFKNHYETIDINFLIKLRLNCMISSLKEKFDFEIFVDVIFKIILLGWKRVLLSLSFVVIVITIIFLHSPYKELEMFNITFHNYSNDYLLNIVYNVIAILLGIDNDFKIIPLNNLGAPIIFLAKIMYYIIIAGVFGQFVLNRIEKFRDEI